MCGRRGFGELPVECQAAVVDDRHDADIVWIACPSRSGRWVVERSSPTLAEVERDRVLPGQFEHHHRQRKVSLRVIAMAQDEAERRLVPEGDLADEIVVLGDRRRDLLEHS